MIWWLVIGGWILYLIFNSSSSETVISHNEFMNKFKTTDDILAEFGVPDSKKELNGFEEWLFKKDKIIIRNKSKNGKNQNFTMGGGAMYKDKYPIGGFNTNSSNTEDETETIREEKSYIKFIIKNDKIINWDTNGLDFTRTL
jgi:hypothetical protein